MRLLQLLFQAGKPHRSRIALALQITGRGVCRFQLARNKAERAFTAHALLLCARQIRLRAFKLRLRRREFLPRRLIGGSAFTELRLRCLHLGAQLLNLIRAAQKARILHPGTACHRAASIDDLAVECDDAESVAEFSRNGNGAIHILCNRCAPNLRLNNRFICCIALYQVRCNGDKAIALGKAPFLQHPAAHGAQWQKCRPTAFRLLQKLDGPLGVAFTVRHNILERCAERRFNSNGILLRHGDQLGKRAVDAAQAAPFCLPHHSAHAACVALHILFHILEHIDARGFLPQVKLQVFLLLLPLFRPDAAGIEPHGVALHRI